MHAPQTLEGHEAWDVIQKGASQLRIASSGRVIGLDMAPLMMIATAQGYALRALTELMSYAEAGLLKASREQHDSDSNT